MLSFVPFLELLGCGMVEGGRSDLPVRANRLTRKFWARSAALKAPSFESNRVAGEVLQMKTCDLNVKASHCFLLEPCFLQVESDTEMTH